MRSSERQSDKKYMTRAKEDRQVVTINLESTITISLHNDQTYE